MNSESAISRVSYAEARSSSAEAMIDIARHRRELETAAAAGQSEDGEVARLEDETRIARAAHKVDKSA